MGKLRKMLWNSMKELWNFIEKPVKGLFILIFCRLLPVCAVLTFTWYTFLKLIGSLPIATTPALIMVWASASLLFFAFFPKLFDGIKRLKLKDFEIELQETVAKSAANKFVSVSDLVEGNTYRALNKGNWDSLTKRLKESYSQPSKPILLMVNLNDNRSISIPMLFAYLYSLDLVGGSVTVIFFSARNKPKDIADIRQDDVVGAVQGRKALQIFSQKFPRLLSSIMRSFFKREFLDPIESEHFYECLFREEFFRTWYDSIKDQFQESIDHPEKLIKRDVELWFARELSYLSIDKNLSSSDIKTIRKALIVENDFILVCKDKNLYSIVPICHLSNKILQRLLFDVE